jgi:6-phosphogluconolactonase (cycloisomerase 2 family)
MAAQARPSSFHGLVLGLVIVLATLLPVSSAGAQGTVASFGQLMGSDGCVRALGAVAFDFGGDPLTGCGTASGLGNPQALTLSPDQRQLLVVAGGGDAGSNAIVTLNRAPSSGALSFASCMSNDGGDGRLGSDGACGDADGLSAPSAVAVTPNGQWLFVASRGASSLTWFARDPSTGALEQRGCLKGVAWPGERCTAAPLLSGASGVAVSADGNFVFVSAGTTGAISTYRRDVNTGALERVSCVSDTGTDGLCANVNGLRGAGQIRIGPHAKTLYVIAPAAGAVSSFAVDQSTGGLGQLACAADRVAEPGACTAVTTMEGVESMILSADGRNLYVGATGDEALTVLGTGEDGALTPQGCFVFQEPQPGDRVDPDDYYEDEEDQPEADVAACTRVRALDPAELALSADGRSLFSTGDDYLAAFRRDPATGALTWAACAEEERTYLTCVQARGLPGSSGIATSADGRNLYVASNSSHSIAVFASALEVATQARILRSGATRVGVRCPAQAQVSCRGTVRHPLLRRAVPYRLKQGQRATVLLRLGRRAARDLHAITLRVSDASRLIRTARHHVTLRR